ncbi:MAG: DPP IV N-terminal domain-containing protein [Planctomycetota bacterium]
MQGSFAALAAVLVSSVLTAQGVRELSLVDCFTMDGTIVPDHEAPIVWLDGSHYLVYGAFERDGEVLRTFFSQHAVDARERVAFVDPGWIEALAGLPGLRRDDLLAATEDPSAFTWAPDHRGFVLDFVDDLFWYDRVHDTAHRLTRDPADEIGAMVSPNGELVAFARDGNLYVVPVTGGEAIQLTSGGSDELLHGRLDWVYQEELYGRGNFQGFWWSPDSTRLALLRLDQRPVGELTIPNDRPGRELHETIRYPLAGDPNPRVDIGVVDAAGGSPRWFDMGQWLADDPLVVRVTWDPTGAEVYFQVQDREQRWLEMIAGDAREGGTRLVFREDSPCWVEAKHEPRFLAGGAEFLWVSERDGYAHVYRYKRDGALVGRLTTGEFEVDELLSIDEVGGFVWFASEGGDWKSQHLYRVPLGGGEIERITKDAGWHEVKLAPDHASFLDEWSRFDRPPTLAIRKLDGAIVREISRPRLEALEAYRLPEEKFVTITARDGVALEALLIEPRDFDARQKYPTIVFQYSGPHSPRVLDRWRWRDNLWHMRMAQRGYFVAIVDCRTGSGKGRVSAQAGYRRLGQTELMDHVDVVGWLVKQGFVDPARIGIWGWSYGGYQTLYDLTHCDLFAAGVAVNPVTDWRFYDTIYTERYMGMPQSNIEGYSAGSALEAAESLRGELMLVASTMDDNVHARNSLRFAWALQRIGRPFRYMPYPQVRHGIEDARQQVHLFLSMESFFDDHLRGRR